MNDVQDLDDENCSTLQKEIEKELTTWKDTPR